MRHRQAIALLALVGLFVALYLWLHALGFGGAIKCGASGGCETVQTSQWAVFLGMPVAFYGVVGYLAILVAAIVALRPAALSQPRWSKWLVLLATVGFGFTLYLTYLELFVIHAICRWCVRSNPTQADSLTRGSQNFHPVEHRCCFRPISAAAIKNQTTGSICGTVRFMSRAAPPRPIFQSRTERRRRSTAVACGTISSRSSIRRLSRS